MNPAPLLVTAADDGYAMALAVMLYSAAASRVGAGRLRAVVLDGGISERNRRRVTASLGRQTERIGVTWMAFPEARVADLPVSGHIRASTYCKLFIPEMLGRDEEKAVYVDADAVVLGNIGELWERDTGGRPLLAARDGDRTVSSPGGLALYERLGIPPDTPYLNAGVLVMDLGSWRRHGYGERIVAYLRENRERVVYHDQDGINAVLAGRWLPLEPCWNYRVDCFESPPAGEDAGAAVSRIRREAAIVHFASATKPWHYHAVHPGKRIFYEFLDRTAWAGWRPRSPLAEKLLTRHFYGRLLRRAPFAGRVWEAVKKRAGAWGFVPRVL